MEVRGRRIEEGRGGYDRYYMMDGGKYSTIS
jgi:hypothetical protein